MVGRSDLYTNFWIFRRSRWSNIRCWMYDIGIWDTHLVLVPDVLSHQQSLGYNRCGTDRALVRFPTFPLALALTTATWYHNCVLLRHRLLSYRQRPGKPIALGCILCNGQRMVTKNFQRGVTTSSWRRVLTIIRCRRISCIKEMNTIVCHLSTESSQRILSPSKTTMTLSSTPSPSIIELKTIKSFSHSDLVYRETQSSPSDFDSPQSITTTSEVTSKLLKREIDSPDGTLLYEQREGLDGLIFGVAKVVQERVRKFYSTTSSVYAEHTISNPNAEQLLFW